MFTFAPYVNNSWFKSSQPGERVMRIEKMGLVVLSFMLLLVILNFAPQVDAPNAISTTIIQDEDFHFTTPVTPPPSMLAYWEMNENEGTAVTDSIVPYVTGYTAGNPIWVSGIAQSGLELHGDQYIDFGRPSYLYLPEVLTIESWVNLPDTSGLHTIIMNAYNPINIQYHFGIQNGHLYFDRQAGVPGNAVTSPASITPGQWHHVVVVMNWSLRRVWFYLDGIDDEIYPYNDAYSGPSGEVTIGADRITGSPSFLNGMIDEVAVYNDMLDQAIIQEHYQKGLHGLGYLEELPANEPPVATDDSYVMDQDDILTVSAPGVLENDFDSDGNTLEPILVTNPNEGTLELYSDGSFVYIPRLGFVGIDVFEYTTFDGMDYSNTAVVTITVEIVNTPPISSDDEYTVEEDGFLSIASPGVLANDTDYQLDSLVAEVVDYTQHGLLLLAEDGSFEYLPDNDWYGIDTFTYRVFDGLAYGIDATVTITVNSVNDAPVAIDDTYSGSEDLSLIGDVTNNDWDIDGGLLGTFLVIEPLYGSLDFYPNGSFTYIPDLNWFGTDSFTYQTYDGDLYSNVAFVTLSIESVNDIPLIVDDEFAGYEDAEISGNVLSNDFDVEWDSCQVFLVTGPLHGVVTLDSTTGSFIYQPDLDWYGIDTFTYNVYDGYVFSDISIVTLTIIGVNDPPVAYASSFDGNEDVVLHGTLPLGFDVEGDSLEYIIAEFPAHGNLVVDSITGDFSYTPDIDWYGTDSFSYQLFDGQAYSNIANVTINIIVDDDTTGPEITITFTGDATDASPGLWTVVVIDLESGVYSVIVEIDGIFVGSSAGSYLTPNTLGIHTINVTATNADSNNGPYDQESSLLTHSVTIRDDDVTAPDISIIYTGEMTDINPGYWTISVSDPESGVSSILVEVDGIAVGTFEGNYSVPSSLGFHTITVTAVNSDFDRLNDQESITHSGVVFLKQAVGISEIIYLGDISGVYSDPAFLEVQLVDAITQLPLAGKMIHFSLGTQYAIAITDADGFASVTLILNQGYGLILLEVSFVGDDAFSGSSSLTEFVINKECAIIVYSGATIIDRSDESITLQATVFDDSDGNLGNLSLAYVTFTIFLTTDTNTPIYITYPINVQTSGLTTVEIPALPVGDYLIVVSLLPEHNRFYCSPNGESATVTVYKPERAHVHGVGSIIAADGHRGFFVFKAKYGCKGNLNGFILYTYIVGDWIYLIRSHELTGLVTDGNHGFFEATGVMTGYNFVTHEKICSGTQYRIRVDVFDNRKTHEKDVFQIRVFDSLGLSEYEAGFNPFGYLLRGCIVVNHERRY
jgi:VCBS repeat-containing protein